MHTSLVLGLSMLGLFGFSGLLVAASEFLFKSMK